MALDNQQLLDEARASTGVEPPERAVSPWLVEDRRRLLPYMAVGGAFAGSLGGIMSTGAGAGDNLAVGLAAGVAAGMAVGWATLAIGHRLLPPHGSGLRMRVVRTVLTLPAYLSSGLVAALTMVALGGRGDQVLGAVPAAMSGLIALGLILVPINLALARGTGRSPIEGGTLRASIGQTWSGATAGPGTWTGSGRVGITAALAVVWLLVATFGVLGLMVVVKSLVPSAYTAAFANFGGPIGIALLVTWLAVIIGGTRLTLRLLFGARPRPPRR